MPTTVQNYFQLFSLPETFDLNLEQLNAAYRALQDKAHPDRFASQNEQERLNAVQKASLINQGFETLKSPLTRAAYLLELRGQDLHQVNQADLSPALLLEQIRLREALEELPRDESALDKLDAMRKEVTELLKVSESNFVSEYKREELRSARHHYHAMQYLNKLLGEIGKLEEDLLGY